MKRSISLPRSGLLNRRAAREYTRAQCLQGCIGFYAKAVYAERTRVARLGFT